FAGQGEAYCGLGLVVEAEESFEIAAANAPDVVEYRRRLAETRLARGKIDGALAALGEASARDPNDPAVRELWARALQMRQTASVRETIPR
ncbi:MAG: tetratricopeptide repeat protein, partial [Thermoguttaceae bacterium]|nr:tetratricopeptide repeat protein [Thermoguttaceae bacterium]